MTHTMKKKLPVGVDLFEKLIRQDFYYVDKTRMIADLLHNWSEVNLFTRPRRFGKSLNMSMLQAFFEIGCDKTLFAGLDIEKETELCERYMGKFPVISISLKGVEGLTYQEACDSLKRVIGSEALRFRFLKDSDKLTAEEKQLYAQLIEVGDHMTGMFTMAKDLLAASLQLLSALLAKHFETAVILLIDEYDVPLDKAYQYGYYDEMVVLIRSLFGNVLKTNPNLYFAVLTGCLRIAKESIFTGLNNFNVMSVLDVQFDEYFGFTEAEVEKMLAYYGFSGQSGVVKEWYDGYQFGKTSVYCPWDVISFCKHLCADPEALPEDYWSNTSSNSIVRRFIDKANAQTKHEIEKLIAGEYIVKEIRQELTYNELDTTIQNLWSVLFTTGYLTQCGREEGRRYRLLIPNREIKELFITQIQEWFQDVTAADVSKLDTLYEAFATGNTEVIENVFTEYLWKNISIRDTAGKKGSKENFYHGLLLGLLSYRDDWLLKSNVETGVGYSDILVEIPQSRTGIVIELKYAEDGNLDQACKNALKQIEEKQYDTKLKEDGMQNILKYGIACLKKNSRVMLAK